MRLALATIMLLVTPALALAHPGHVETTGFTYGFEHPMAGLDHVLAMLAVGVFAFLLGRRALWLVPLSFVLMMLVGFGLGLAHINLPLAEFGIALSSIAIGGAAALNRPMRVSVAMALVGAFAVFHGYAHGVEMPASASSLGYASGFVLATGLLHVMGIVVTFATAMLVGRYAKIIARCSAAVFALGGVGVLAGWI